MSTASDIVRRGLRAIGYLGRGREATGRDLTDGLERLQGLLLDLPGLVQNARWIEVAVDSAEDANEGERLTVTGAITVTLPTTVTDEDTSEVRPPKDMARVQVVGSAAVVDYGGEANGVAGTYLYSATKGAWGPVTDLATSTELPFGAEDDEGLSAYFAVAVVDDYGGSITDRTAIKANTWVRAIRARLNKATPADDMRPNFGMWSGDYI